MIEIHLQRRHRVLFGTLRYCGLGPIPAPKECQWIDGQPGDPICGKATVEGSAWCGEHKARAFIRRAVAAE